MQLRFEWQAPVILTLNKKITFGGDDLLAIADVPGIYYFARNFAENSKPFYIGETQNLRTRLKNHLAGKNIADILRGMKVEGAPRISNGRRSFHYAYFRANRGQDTKKSLRIAQKFLIGEAIAADIPLLNSHLTVIKTHSLEFVGDKSARGVFKRTNVVTL